MNLRLTSNFYCSFVPVTVLRLQEHSTTPSWVSIQKDEKVLQTDSWKWLCNNANALSVTDLIVNNIKKANFTTMFLKFPSGFHLFSFVSSPSASEQSWQTKILRANIIQCGQILGLFKMYIFLYNSLTSLVTQMRRKFHLNKNLICFKIFTSYK